MHYFSKVKSFWPVQNNQPAIDVSEKLNSRNKVLSITTYDFSTPYTNIPHNKRKNVMSELINACFKGGKEQFIA